MSFAIPYLDRATADFFELNGVSAVVLGGRRERAKQLNQGPSGANRVVFEFGDDSGRVGRIVPTIKPGHRSVTSADGSRSIALFEMLYRVSIWAADRDAPRDEHAQFSAAFDLLEQVVRAVQDAAEGNHTWGSVVVTPAPKELAFGCELRVELTHRFPIYDAPPAIAFPDNAIERELLLDPPAP